MKKKFIEVLTVMAEKDKDLIVLVGDLGYGVFNEFREKFSKQFINMGIAEQNMIGVAAGLAITGKKVVVYSIIPFVTFRCLEQIKNDLCMPNLNVVIVGVGAGFQYSTSGPSHHGICDIGVMNSLPNLTILSPSTEKEVELCTKNLFNINGPVYMRLGKLLNEKEDKKDIKFKEGTWYGEINHVDVTLITTGEILNKTLNIMNLLNRSEIKCNVLNFHMLKPLDMSRVLAASFKTKLLVTIEEHNITGGLGTIIANNLSQYKLPFKLLKIGINDKFVKDIGSIEYIRKCLKLTSNDIIKKIRNTLILIK